MSTSTRHKNLGGCRVGRVPPQAKRRQVKAAQHLPQQVDLRPHLTKIEEQVGMSCVANTCAGAYEYLAKRHLGKSADVSRLFIYYNARLEDGDEGVDDGTTMQSAIEGLKKYGACKEDLWPNDEDYINEEPNSESYEHGAYFKIAEAEYVETDLTLWQQTLASGYPIAFCLNTFSSFDDATENKGRVPIPKKNEQEREEHGWHSMLCVGYLAKDQMFIVRNSWGTAWGDKGYCYIPYKYVIHDELNGHDSWIIKALDDLDFSSDISSEEDNSYFASEDSIQLFDFYLATDDVEGFATALESLCEEYCSEESFYFDYEETEEDGITYAEITNFDLSLADSDPDSFIEALDSLCQEWAEDENYDYTISGNEDTETESEETDNEADDGTLTLTGFYIYTDEAEAVIEKLEKLLIKHSKQSDYYEYEWQEEEDDTGTYIDFTSFAITPDDYDAFLSALESFCEKQSNDNGYNWDEPEA